MTKQKISTVKSRRSTYLYIGLPILSFLFFGAFILYNFIFSSKVFPNLYLGDINLGGLSANSAYTAVNDKYNIFLNSPLKFNIGDKTEVSNVGDWGIVPDPEATTKKIYEAGRSGNVVKDCVFRLKALITKTKVEPIYKIDSSKFALKFDNTFEKYNINAKDAALKFEGGNTQIISEADGQIVDAAGLIDSFKRNIKDLKPEPIQVQIISEKPKINKVNLAALQKKINLLGGQAIVLTFGEDSWHLSNSNLFDMFRFYPAGYEDNNLASFDLGLSKLQVKSIDINSSEPLALTIHLDNLKLSSYIDDISKRLDRPAKDATLKFEGGKVSEFSPAQDGQILNKQLLASRLSDVLSINNDIPDKQISIALPVVVTRAKIANNEINNLGIRELIGKGVSYFAHSIPNRAWNVGLGTSRVSGTLVAPGEIFSFNRSVGEVNGATGYRQAYVISEGKTVLDDGGGICQVSTTVFRAALNAGLPIVSRTAHAYRVGYYEQNGTKPGFDATVFAPSVDFQFKNDTANSVLVQAVADQNLARLEVDIYGTSDGRRVQIGDSIVSNQVPALPDKRQDDPTLPAGQVKQVDFAAAGATAVFTRKVYRGNDLILDDVFKSVYRPWAAVYLVGTKS